MTTQQAAVADACFGYSSQRLDDLGDYYRLAYYTTAETALKMIEDGTFWLRNPRLMNDYAEVVHAQKCIDSVLNRPEIAKHAAQTVNVIFPNMFERIKSIWGEFRSSQQYPFIACVSEIAAEDQHGRLSMWRAYGGKNGVALVLRNELLHLDTSFINTFNSPILYGVESDVHSLMVEIFDRLLAVQAEARIAGEAYVLGKLKDALNFAMVSIKHPGFEEEREWRMVHHYQQMNSPFLNYKSAVVRGNAEVLCEINLRAHQSLRPGTLIEKVIVGPCQFPENTAEAIRLAFVKANEGVPDIVVSGIPLRHS